jgi:hypothetical protein
MWLRVFQMFCLVLETELSRKIAAFGSSYSADANFPDRSCRRLRSFDLQTIDLQKEIIVSI